MEVLPFSCRIKNSDPSTPLGIKVLINETEIYNNSNIVEPVDFTFDIDTLEDQTEHKIQFIMFGKTQNHTKLDEQGNIVKDAVLSISDINVDGIDIQQIFTEQATYTHDFNGTQQQTQQSFYGNMGCNGTVSMKFVTPFYLWLLENM